MNVKKPKSLLLVNDDPNDLAALARRMPDGVDVTAASQREAREMTSVDADLIILDNDANDRKRAEGPATLAALRQAAPNVPVVYTSYLPGWVEQDVRHTSGVSVVKTDQLPDWLAEAHGVVVRPARRKPPAKDDGSTSVIMSYNPVDNYPEGDYGDGKLVVLAYDRMAKAKAREVLQEQINRIYRRYSWRDDRRRIRNIFVYDGINGGEMPGRLAATLAHDTRIKVKLLACRCEWERKVAVARTMSLSLWPVECRGNRSLGMIADVVLGVKRAHVDYRTLPFSKTSILRHAASA